MSPPRSVATRPRAFAGTGGAAALAALAALAGGCGSGRPETPPPPTPSASQSPTISQAVWMNGRPFPERPVFSSELAPPARILHVSARAAAAGDGSAARPWKDLESALRSLAPGDRLVVAEGKYPAGIRIDGRCSMGTETAPIQVVFEKAVFEPSGASAALTVARAHWRFEGLAADLGDAAAPAFVAEGPEARGITLDRARISDGSGPGIRIGAGASRVTIANSVLSSSRRHRFPTEGSGIEIADGTRDIVVIASFISNRPDGAIRVGGAAAEAPPLEPPRRITLSGNTLLDSHAPAIRIVRASGLEISSNTISRSGSVALPGGRAIVIEWAADATVKENHLSNASLGVQIGWGEPGGPGFSRPADVLVARNFFESPAAPDSAGIDVESGVNVRLCNNVFHDVADAILLFGSPPRTEALTVANNLVLGVTTAFRMDDPACAKWFDRNVFSPRGTSAEVEVSGKSMDLAKFLGGSRMPETRLVPTARMIHKDLGRIEGIATKDAGVPVRGLTFLGAAPDLGVFER
ncbi:MAG: right-handed parallel beta-helix repeat-containing protein [Acidobacteriota bacterium]